MTRSSDERRVVTILFADLVNSTTLAERLGAEEWTAVIRGSHERLGAAITRHGGRVAQYLGDGLLAFFGAPAAHEADPIRGVHAALDMLLAAGEYAAELRRERGIDFAVRVGINTGEVVMGDVGTETKSEYLAMGDAVNVASRLQGAARPMTVLLSEQTHRLVAQAFDCTDVGPLNLKGRAEPVRAFEVRGLARVSEDVPRHWLTGSGRSIVAPFVGRAAELSAFSVSLRRLAEGEGGVLSLIGDAGLGKSRLLSEARAAFGDHDVRWLEGHALSVGRSLPHWPFIEMVRRDAGITDTDDGSAAWRKLQERIRTLRSREADEIAPYLGMLLSLEAPEELAERVRHLDGEGVGRQIFRSTRLFFAGLAEERPTVLVFEDVHWLDQSSKELLQHLLPLVKTVPLLICATSRPEPNTPAAELRRVAQSDYAQRYAEIELGPLSQLESVELARRLLASEDLAPRVQEVVLEKAAGNPFFAEEVVRSLIDIGALVRDDRGHWRATDVLDQVSIPDTLRGLLVSRIDRLDLDLKDVLKVAAVVGRTFFYRVLQAVSAAGDSLRGHVLALGAIELIRERRRDPELEYMFTHALVQEAVYESMLVRQRRELHGRVATSIELLFPTRIDEFAGVLAFHYARAEDWSKARFFLLKAGDQAGSMAADVEALAHYQQALDAYVRAFGSQWDPIQRATLERKMGEALFRRGQHEEATAYVERSLRLLGRPYPRSRWGIRRAIAAGTARQIARLTLPGIFARKGAVKIPDERLAALSRSYEVLGWMDYFTDQERFVLDGLLELTVSETSGFAHGIARGSTIMGLICDLVPAFRVAAWYHASAISAAGRTDDPTALGVAYLGGCIHEFAQGNWAKSLDLARLSKTEFDRVGDLRGAGGAIGFMDFNLIALGNLRECEALARESLRLARDAGDHQVEGWRLMDLAGVLCRSGALDDAVDHAQKAIALLRPIPDYLTVVCTTGHLASSYVRLGRFGDAIDTVDENERLVRSRGLRGVFCTSHRASLAEAYVAAVEQGTGPDRRAVLRKADRACELAVRHGRLDRSTLPIAYRLRGTLDWLRGDRSRSIRWWSRSRDAAEVLGARYELARTHLEIGRRLGSSDDLRRAESLFSDVGAQWDLDQARRAIAARSTA